MQTKWEAGGAAPAQWWREALSPRPFLPPAPGVLPLSPPTALWVQGQGYTFLPTSLVLLSNTRHMELSASLRVPHPSLRRSSIPSLLPTPAPAGCLTSCSVSSDPCCRAGHRGDGRDPCPDMLHLEQGRKHCPIVGQWWETSRLPFPPERGKGNQTQSGFFLFLFPIVLPLLSSLNSLSGFKVDFTD